MLAGGVLLHLAFGCFYLIGNISEYVASYLHRYDESISLSSMTILLPIMVILWSTFMFVGPFLIARLKIWQLISIAGTIVCVGTIASSFVHTLWLFILTFCLGFGMGIGLAYMVPILCGWDWFPNNKGMVSGVVLTGFGLGTFVFSYIAIEIVNPEDESPNL